MFLLIGSFIAGMLTVLAPCVLILLPVIIGGSVTGEHKDKKRPVIITLSLAISLIGFTLLLKATSLLINVPPSVITAISGGIIVILGIVTLFPDLYTKIIIKLGIEPRAQALLGSGLQNKSQYIGPIIIGAALGPVFSSCSPVYAYILATVLPVNFGQALVYITAYTIGLSLILLLIGYYGRDFIVKIRFASNPYGIFQRTIAVVFIIVGLMIITGYDKKFQAYVADHTGLSLDGFTSLFLPEAKNKIDDSKLFNVTAYKAPQVAPNSPWINSKPLKPADLKGKVVLVDFWTYSCINCIRNNPYIEKWYETYKDQGFMVIGVHAPEFAFEKVSANVEKAVKDQKLTYPIVLDNDFLTWNNFANRSWPASYLIDADGKVRRIHEGEGKYKESEDAIRQLLVEKGAKLSANVVGNDVSPPITASQTPETYLGSKRASNYAGSPAIGSTSDQPFTHPDTLDLHHWSLGGSWKVDGEKITSTGSSTLQFHVAAKNVYVVGGSTMPQKIKVLLNGKPVAANAGEDVKNSTLIVGESKLYRIISYPVLTQTDTLELQVPNGIKLNAFTFGS
jgi:cytochrome c biogenesis protein CcdA/thiol-disulfide isomerase/thioredoxin